MKTITFKRQKMSARQLVAHWYGDRNVDDDAVRDAVTELMRRGWLTAFVPKPPDWDRTMVFVPQHNDFAAILRYVDYNGVGVVPRGLIESRTQLPLSNIGTGLFMSHIGIAITNIDGNNVFIRGTTPALALMAHQARIHPLEQMPTAALINAAIGTPTPRRHRDPELLLRAALAFDEFNIDVPGLLDGEDESDVQSRWLFPTPPSPVPSPRSIDSAPPPPPAAPFEPPLDPDIPPF
jgi:hypothetical protein